jgi:hypothetical protein
MERAATASKRYQVLRRQIELTVRQTFVVQLWAFLK